MVQWTMRKRIWGWSGAAGLVIAAACGGSGGTGAGGSGAGVHVGGGGSGVGGATTATSSGAGGDVGFDAGNGSSSGGGGAPACTGSTVQATLVPLDIFIMLDKSGSMSDKTGTMGQGVPKWDAVTQALKAFFADPQSSGIGVGLQFFPLTALGAPSSCGSQADCGQFGPCFLKVCSGNTGIVCTANADCGGQGPCASLGQCQNDKSTFCLPIGATCNGNKGSCVQVTSSVCLNVDSCAAADYGTPAVPIDLLNAAAPGLSAAIDATMPEGATPTAPALQGAIDYAKTWAAGNPTHKVVALLATDGLPTECSPLDTGGISAIAAAGLTASPSVSTFVIGVFAGNDPTAKATVDQIAAAGGTTSAFYVDANQNVNQAFLDALNAIRGTKLACEYQIPAAPPGETLDYGQVNVKHTPAGSTTPETIYYVASAAACDPVTGGWYYDVDPSMSAPTKIIVCPETCGSFGLGGQVDVQLGCKTETKPPK